jgi:rhodanese-related sulfurtransferase
MKKTRGLLVIMLGLLIVVSSGTASASFWKKSKAYDFKTITKEELSAKIASGASVQIVNVLSPDYYKLGVIKGSKKIPLNELDQRLGELDKDKEVVTYCASYKCSASREAAKKLAKLGFNVRAYEGGAKEWKEAGLPIET